MSKYFFLLLLISSSAFAAKKTTDDNAAISVRDEAVMENESIDKRAYKKTIQASEAQQANVSSFLKLQDPAPELKQRVWSWDIDLKLQTMKPSGAVQVNGLALDLGEYGQGVMPSLDLGFLYPVTPQDPYQFSTGAGISAGYMTQKTTLIGPTGYQFTDTRLSTSLLAAVWKNQLRDRVHSNWSYLIDPEVGMLTYTQGSTQSSLANFTQQSGFYGLGLGVDYRLSRQWGVLAQYDYRTGASAAAKAQIQQDNFEIGTTITW